MAETLRDSAAGHGCEHCGNGTRKACAHQACACRLCRFRRVLFPALHRQRNGKANACAPFHIKAANKVLNERNLKAAFKWHRSAAKSIHLGIFIPLWLKCQEIRQINVMVLVGKSEENACTCWPTYRPNCNTTSGTSTTSANSITTVHGRRASS